MMRLKSICKNCLLPVLLATGSFCLAQPAGRIDSFKIYEDVLISIDRPQMKHNRETVVILYALPNGNSTAQTMGKRMQPGDDWHVDIQHIKAQTGFIRNAVRKNIVVIYLENTLKSWPAWKRKYEDGPARIKHIVDTLFGLFNGAKSLQLNAHSGGGSFIFGYLAAVAQIPPYVYRISFIDSNYGYDSLYTSKFTNWLKDNRHAHLNVFAYNDSVALYNGKPVVTALGGTWHRSHMMLEDLGKTFQFSEAKTDSLQVFKSRNKRIQFFLKPNYNQGIYHTQQVELNGFIHAVFAGTRHDGRGYTYYGKRAYENWIGSAISLRSYK